MDDENVDTWRNHTYESYTLVEKNCSLCSPFLIGVN